LYKDGKPLHYLDSARSVAFDPKDRGVSSIFVVDAADFKRMAPQQVQEVFRHRHILVLGVETEAMKFDLVGLGSMGCLNATRSVQGEDHVLFSHA
jgi:hypothetical protein